MAQGLVRPTLLGTHISTGTFDQFVAGVADLKAREGSGYTCCVNAHMVVEGHRDAVFQQVVNQADFATPDGAPIKHSLKLLYGLEQERVPGPDLMPALFGYAERHGLSVYFYGDTEVVLEELVRQVQRHHPQLEVAGFYSPPFRALTEEEEQRITERINEAAPDLLFVALGCPKQEKWMAAHRGKVFASMVGVGYAFRTYAGLASRAPRWVQALSLEWLHRLLQNPQKLWKRYLVTNSFFLWLVGKAWLVQKLNPKSRVASPS